MRAAHAPTSLAETYGARSRGARVTAAVAATLGVAADKTGRVVATCGADGTVLVTPVEQLSRTIANKKTRRAYEEAAVRSGRRFVGAHAGATRGVTFLQTYENAERRRDCLMATVGEGRVLCVWDVRAGALESVSRDERVGTLSDERDPRETFEPYGRSVGKLSDERASRETKQKAFGLAPSENSAPFDARASRGAPSSAGYARALPEPWAYRSHVESDRDGAKKNWLAFPSRTVGLAAGASAAAEERTENAAAAPPRRRLRALCTCRAGRADVRGGRRGGHRAHGRGQDASHPPGGPRGRDHRVGEARRLAARRLRVAGTRVRRGRRDDSCLGLGDGRDALHGDARVVRRRSERLGVLAERDAPPVAGPGPGGRDSRVFAALEAYK